MDKGLQSCLDFLCEALQDTREPVDKVRWARDHYKVAGKECVKDVAVITFFDGRKLCVNIDGDSNLAAMYDILAVLMKRASRAGVTRLTYPASRYPRCSDCACARCEWVDTEYCYRPGICDSCKAARTVTCEDEIVEDDNE